MMWGVIHVAASVGVLFLTMATLPLPVSSSQEAARLRCQKSGCPTEGADQEPTLIVDAPSTKVFPLVLSWVIAFFILRLVAKLIRQSLPVLRRIIPQIGAVVGHYYDYIIHITTRIISNGISIGAAANGSSQRGTKNNRGRLNSRSSNKSLGSLADLIDDSSREWNDNDSYSSAGYSSAYSSYASSDNGDATSIEDGMSSALESHSGFGLSVLTDDSSADSTYNYKRGKHKTYNRDYDGDQSRGAESILSKFLDYISESSPRHFQPQSPQQKIERRNNTKRRSSLDYHNSSNDDYGNNHAGIYNRSGKESLSQRRRSTVDEMHYPSHRSQLTTTSERGNQGREGGSNVQESYVRAQGKPTVGGSVKNRNGNNGNNRKMQSSIRQQQQQPQQQQQQTRHDKQEHKKKPTLGHHLSKHSSSKKDDNENYSTALSTVDLRSRVTRDTRR